jgi:two-component system, chemotaxis family, protein-glutamate methylesterase/glutaminase
MSLSATNRLQVRVLVVDDSAFMRTALSRMITSEPGFEVVGTACSGSEALDKIPVLDPDVITLDIEMPGLNGLQTLHRIMTHFPRPVIMVSAATERDADTTFNALSAGAFDYIPKQLSSTSLDILHIQQDLVDKIRAEALSRRPSSAGTFFRKPPQSSPAEFRDADSLTPAIVALGSSTGGPKALQEILPLLPADLSVPILIVQHMPRGFTAPFAQRLNNLSAVSVREAAHRDLISPGVVYIAPAGMHMTVDRPSASRAFICLDTHPENCLHMPSVDIMMQSVARTFRNLAMGIILTGMGSDGAEGMMAIHRQGGLTLGQDEASCIVYGMPRACAELGALTRAVPLSQIPAQILHATRFRRRA